MITDKRYFHTFIIPAVYVVFGGIPGYLANVTFTPFFVLSGFYLAHHLHDVSNVKLLLGLLGIGIFAGGFIRWFIDPENVYMNVENISWLMKFALAFLPSIAFYTSARMALHIHNLHNERSKN